MDNPGFLASTRELVHGELEKIRSKGFHGLRFDPALEWRFEQDTKKARSHRLWLEGLLAIIVFNICLLIDHLTVHDPGWNSILNKTIFITPLALVVNALMRTQPPRWLREGSVAMATAMICYINLFAQGGEKPTTTLFGIICLIITSLFAGVVMRLRFAYAAGSMIAMLLGGFWFLHQSAGLKQEEAILAGSLMIIGVGITLVASYGLERQERTSYLLYLRSDLQGEELIEINAELQRLSTIDKLTGLPNRRSLEERFAEMWIDGEMTGAPMSSIVIDVDHFKVINDVYGHLYGDEALRRIAGLLPQALRGTQDFAGRFGGEEFVILLPNTERDVALGVAERVRILVETAGTPITDHPSGQTMLWTTVSCGVATAVPDGLFHRDNLIKAADTALYASKHNGRNRVEFAEVEWTLRAVGSLNDRRTATTRRITDFVTATGVHSIERLQTQQS